LKEEKKEGKKKGKERKKGRKEKKDEKKKRKEGRMDTKGTKDTNTTLGFILVHPSPFLPSLISFLLPFLPWNPPFLP
jgi:hypothetical protein